MRDPRELVDSRVISDLLLRLEVLVGGVRLLDFFGSSDNQFVDIVDFLVLRASGGHAQGVVDGRFEHGFGPARFSGVGRSLVFVCSKLILVLLELFFRRVFSSLAIRGRKQRLASFYLHLRYFGAFLSVTISVPEFAIQLLVVFPGS